MLRSVDSDNNQTEETNMGIEQAILELAAAIRYAADKDYSTTRLAVASGLADAAAPLDTIEQDVAKVETDAKAAQQKAMDKVSTGKAEIAAALAAAKAEKEAAQNKADDAAKAAAFQAKIDADNAVACDPLDAAPLDWDKDVRPALLAVGKDRDALVKLMGKYEVPKGGKAPTEKWADLLAEANAIVAARG